MPKLSEIKTYLRDIDFDESTHSLLPPLGKLPGTKLEERPLSAARGKLGQVRRLFAPTRPEVIEDIQEEKQQTLLPQIARQEAIKREGRMGLVRFGDEGPLVDPLGFLGGLRRVGAEGVQKVTPKVFGGLKNLSTKLLEKFKGMPEEITPQQFNEVINKAQKEGIRKADLDLIKEAAERQMKVNIPDEALSLARNAKDSMSSILKETIDDVEDMVPKGLKIVNVKLFGSASKGKFVQGKSDIDLVVIFNKKLTNEQHNWLIPSMNDTLAHRFGEIKGKGFIKPKVEIISGSDISKSEKIFGKIVEKEAIDISSGKLSLSQLAKDVKTQLVPLTPTQVKSPRWSSVGEDFIGDGKYGEIVYQSPIKTSAGDVHFLKSPSRGWEQNLTAQARRRLDTLSRRSIAGTITDAEATEWRSIISQQQPQDFPNYFSHIRYEDMADGKTRKILETQSDLFQKGRLERELEIGPIPGPLSAKERVSKLEPYSSNRTSPHLPRRSKESR